MDVEEPDISSAELSLAGELEADSGHTGAPSAGISGVSRYKAVLPAGNRPVSRPAGVYGWGAARAMRIPEVHSSGITGKGVKVAVLDTGISPHPALRIQGGFNSIDSEAPDLWRDQHWHGTHVAGILAATGAANGMTGVAPECELYAVRVGRVRDATQSQFSNLSIETDLVEGLRWCIDQGMDVVNMSLFVQPSPVLDALLEEAYQKGLVLVAPSGNLMGGGQSGPGTVPSDVDYPARHPRVLSVGAVGRLGVYPDNSYFTSAEVGGAFSQRFPDYYVPGFSKAGPGLNVVAPGVAILSTVPPTLNGWDEQDRRLTGYTTWMGTSQAAPFIAGLCALILESHPQLLVRKEGTRVDAVRTILLRACVDLGLPTARQGAGMPYAPACLGPDEFSA